ncbi:MAG: metal ABC transporter substrate-binding protein [Lactobacillales bacterium]|nr:metal ABC transporter substrate-binding protein [Lactobacillales bacterium]
MSEKKATSENKIKIVTTFFPMYDFTKNIVGDEGNVELLIPAGTEPHDFEPSAKNMADIAKASVFVYNSKNLETWVPNAINSLGVKTLNVIEASEKIKLMEATEEADEYEGNTHEHNLDPHVWLAPALAKKEVETIRDGLISEFPTKKEVFTKNAAAYLKKLTALDEDYKKELANATQRNLVTQHAAFGYLAKEYGLHQVAIAGLSPDQEPSPSRLAELKDYVKKNHIQLIYFEETASDKIAKTLSDETGVQLAVLNTLEGLTKEEQKQGADYISVMQDNLKELKKTIK